jgi:hypothetical protein
MKCCWDWRRNNRTGGFMGIGTLLKYNYMRREMPGAIRIVRKELP